MNGEFTRIEHLAVGIHYGNFLDEKYSVYDLSRFYHIVLLVTFRSI